MMVEFILLYNFFLQKSIFYYSVRKCPSLKQNRNNQEIALLLLVFRAALTKSRECSFILERISLSFHSVTSIAHIFPKSLLRERGRKRWNKDLEELHRLYSEYTAVPKKLAVCSLSNNFFPLWSLCFWQKWQTKSQQDKASQDKTGRYV